MSATRQTRAAHQHDGDEVTKQPAPEADVEAEGQPPLPDLSGGPLQPETWLSLQQTIGNSAVGGLVEKRRAGQPLPAATRRDMETSFGRSFGQVQIHTGPEVDQAAQSLDAAAFTVGDGVYLHTAVPGFDDPFGRQVLGEELAHVAQGVGAEGPARLTDPDEPAEREAHAAGRAAATGQHAVVSPAPEAAGAVARFGFGDLKRLYESATNGGETAARVEPAELRDEDKDRLAAGALDPLASMMAVLAGKVGGQGGKVDPKTLQPISDNTAGISKFIMSFSGPPAVQPLLESAAMSAANGRNALLAAIDPAQSVKDVAEGMASTAAEIEGFATPPPAAVPAPDPAPAPGGAAPETLSSAEAEQLKTGAVEPLRSVAEQLQGEAPDLDVIIARLHGIPGLLRSYTKPAALAPQLRRKAMSVEVQTHALQSVAMGAESAITSAMGEWASAIGTLAGLTAKSTGGAAGTATTDAGAADGADDDQKKTN